MPLPRKVLETLIDNGDINISPYSSSNLTDNSYKLHIDRTVRSVSTMKDYVDEINSTTSSIIKSLTIPDTGIILDPNVVYELDLIESVVSEDYSGQIVPNKKFALDGVNITISSNVSAHNSGKLTAILTSTGYVRIYPNQEIAEMYFTPYNDNGVPIGTIVMWSGYKGLGIPQGWVLCNGEYEGVPNLSNRFILGSGSRSIGVTGGSETVQLTTEQLPAHMHDSGSLSASGGTHTHPVSTQPTYISGTSTNNINGNGISNYGTSYMSEIGSGEHTHTISGNTGSTGNNQAHDNMPPYYVLAFIMKIK